jgi:hypothetical protein
LFCLILGACVQQSSHTDSADLQISASEKASSHIEEKPDFIAQDTQRVILQPVKDISAEKEVPRLEKPIMEKEEVTPSSIDKFKTQQDPIQPGQNLEEPPERPTDSVQSMELEKKQVSEQIDPIVTSPPDYPDHSGFNQLLEAYVSSDGKVNYAGLRSVSPSLDQYLTQLKNNAPKENWPRNEQLAFWINAYNAFTIRLILDNYPVKSILDIENGKPWDKKWIQIGEQSYSLNQIENDIIRPEFKEPRIHFAINCAAVSCPQLGNQAFTTKNINQLLEKQTRVFINHSAFNQVSKDTLVLSQIFEWYGSDFPDLISFLNRYVGDQIRRDAKISFNDYNWDLNQ